MTQQIRATTRPKNLNIYTFLIAGLFILPFLPKGSIPQKKSLYDMQRLTFSGLIRFSCPLCALYARLNAGQYVSSRYATIVMDTITRIVIFHPSLNIYFGGRPYPTGTALMDVGSMYDRFTPMDAI